MSLNKSKDASKALLGQEKEGPIVNITIDNNGAKITIGGVTGGSNGNGSANATVAVDPIKGSAGVSGAAAGGANATIPP